MSNNNLLEVQKSFFESKAISEAIDYIKSMEVFDHFDNSEEILDFLLRNTVTKYNKYLRRSEKNPKISKNNYLIENNDILFTNINNHNAQHEQKGSINSFHKNLDKRLNKDLFPAEETSSGNVITEKNKIFITLPHFEKSLNHADNFNGTKRTDDKTDPFRFHETNYKPIYKFKNWKSQTAEVKNRATISKGKNNKLKNRNNVLKISSNTLINPQHPVKNPYRPLENSLENYFSKITTSSPLEAVDTTDTVDDTVDNTTNYYEKQIEKAEIKNKLNTKKIGNKLKAYEKILKNQFRTRTGGKYSHRVNKRNYNKNAVSDANRIRETASPEPSEDLLKRNHYRYQFNKIYIATTYRPKNRYFKHSIAKTQNRTQLFKNETAKRENQFHLSKNRDEISEKVKYPENEIELPKNKLKSINIKNATTSFKSHNKTKISRNQKNIKNTDSSKTENLANFSNLFHHDRNFDKIEKEVRIEHHETNQASTAIILASLCFLMLFVIIVLFLAQQLNQTKKTDNKHKIKIEDEVKLRESTIK